MRLTFEGNFCDISKCYVLDQNCTGICSQKEVWQRLKYYEDLAEEGKLLELPCPIGSRIYMIVTKRATINHPPFSFVRKTRLTYNNLQRVMACYGSTVFLTRGAAELTLRMMKGKEDAE